MIPLPSCWHQISHCCRKRSSSSSGKQHLNLPLFALILVFPLLHGQYVFEPSASFCNLSASTISWTRKRPIAMHHAWEIVCQMFDLVMVLHLWWDGERYPYCSAEGGQEGADLKVDFPFWSIDLSDLSPVTCSSGKLLSTSACHWFRPSVAAQWRSSSMNHRRVGGRASLPWSYSRHHNQSILVLALKPAFLSNLLDTCAIKPPCSSYHFLFSANGGSPASSTCFTKTSVTDLQNGFVFWSSNDLGEMKH